MNERLIDEILSLRREFRQHTIIELFMATAVLGVLLSAALPRYTGYVRRTRATEAISRLSAIMTASKAFYQKTGHWPQVPREEGYYADFSSTEHFSYDILTGGGSKQFVLRAAAFDLDDMKDVMVIMSCQDVSSSSIVEVRGVWKGSG
jgi:Tfp pilus assembly protein PilE